MIISLLIHQLTTFSTISLQDISILLPNSLFIPNSMQYTPSHLNVTLREHSMNSIQFSLSDMDFEFSTSPTVFDMNMITSPIQCSIPSLNK